MRREINLIAIVALLVMLGGCTPTPTLTPTPTSQVWSLEGRFVDFTSICDLEPAPSPPSKHVRQSGRWIFTGCAALDKELQQPLAIIITIRNSTDTSHNLIVPLLSDVVVHAKAGSEPALAFWFPGFWSDPGWVAKVEGAELEVEIEPGVAIELLYLVPQFSGEATIEVANIGSFKV